MRKFRKCSSNKKSNGCNNGMNNNYNHGMNNNGCNNGMNNNYNNVQNQCNQYKQLAQQKCDQAENINCKANNIAQQAVAAEQQAQALKQYAQQQCQNANDLWDQYNQLAQQGICLMQQAQDCLAKSAECYANLYNEEQRCNLFDYAEPAVANNMNQNTHQNYVSWEVLNAWNKCMEHKHGHNNGCGHGCNNCGCGCH